MGRHARRGAAGHATHMKTPPTIISLDPAIPQLGPDPQDRAHQVQNNTCPSHHTHTVALPRPSWKTTPRPSGRAATVTDMVNKEGRYTQCEQYLLPFMTDERGNPRFLQENQKQKQLLAYKEWRKQGCEISDIFHMIFDF